MAMGRFRGQLWRFNRGLPPGRGFTSLDSGRRGRGGSSRLHCRTTRSVPRGTLLSVHQESADARFAVPQEAAAVTIRRVDKRACKRSPLPRRCPTLIVPRGTLWNTLSRGAGHAAPPAGVSLRVWRMPYYAHHAARSATAPHRTFMAVCRSRVFELGSVCQEASAALLAVPCQAARGDDPACPQPSVLGALLHPAGIPR